MRELCHLGTGTHITGEVLAGHAPCLPQQFNALGYQTIAFHGYRGTMFHREDWYPLVGFKQTAFLADMEGEPMCNGAFYGACDAAIAARLDRRLAAQHAAHGPPRFLYWMTLNGHLPVDAAGAPHHECPVTQDQEVCAQMADNTEVLTAVKSLAMDPAIGSTVIVIVGDHAPPYLTVENRDLFEQSEVPFVLLEPRSVPTAVAGN
jgi:phosphoglycerol transferase MdoB-like AlkP superfamily enzyme